MACTDVAMFTETHAASPAAAAALSMPGFTAFHSVRPNDGPGRGGAAVFVRAGLAGHVQLVGSRQAPGMESVWVRISSAALNGEVGRGRDLLIGAVYAAPLNSTEYADAATPDSDDDEATDQATPLGSNRARKSRAARSFMWELQSAINAYKQPSDMLMLAGDFNARIHALDDTITADQGVIEHLDALDRFDIAPPLPVVDYSRVPVRQSLDVAAPNAAGRALCTVARANSIVVLNGRVPGDVPGALTFIGRNHLGGGSMIDLFVADPDLLYAASDLRVHQRLHYPSSNHLISDHCPVTLRLEVADRSKFECSAATRAHNTPATPLRLDEDCWRIYCECFDASDLSKVQEIEQQLLHTPPLCSTTDAYDRLCKLVRRAFHKMKRRLRSSVNTNAASVGLVAGTWWNDACAAARAALQAFLSTAPRAPGGGLALTVEQRAKQSELRSTYTRVRREAKREHESRVAEELLRKLAHEPWSVFRHLKGSGQREPCSINLDVWAAHGRKLHTVSAAAAAAAADISLAHRILNVINLPDEILDFESAPSGRSWASCAPVQARVELARVLNSALDPKETEHALKRLALNKAGGPDKLPGEAWRCALRPDPDHPDRPVHMLSSCIHALFTRVFVERSQGCEPDLPEQFQVSNWGAVFKSGNADDPANYRGIAVGNVLCKAFMTVLTQRISDWSVDCKVRHPAQAGFMRGMSVSHQHFIMRHITTQYCTPPPKGSRRGGRRAQPLFVCQIDFSKAFDKVPHAVLWERLQERGVHGVMLDTLQKCYENVLLRPRVNGQAQEPFQSNVGVKQGDPASPDLFGLFIETFSDYIDAMDRRGLPIRCPATGKLWDPCTADSVLLDGVEGPVRAVSLLFADDINLLALSSDRMNYLLALLAVFCDAFGMAVNVKKTELLVFHHVLAQRERAAAQPIFYRGERLAAKARARYLGLHYGPPGRGACKRTSIFVDCWRELLAAGKHATHSLWSKLSAHGLHIPSTVLQYYNLCVRSIYSFGAQVWSTQYLTCNFQSATKHDMVKEQLAFMRKVSGAYNASKEALFLEFSQLPLQHHWAGLVFRFWNNMVNSNDSLCHSAFRSDIRMSFEKEIGWTHDVLRFLRSLQLPDLTLPDLTTHTLDELVAHYSAMKLGADDLQTAVAHKLQAVWSDPTLNDVDPRTYNGSIGLSVCRYVRWMGIPVERENGRGALAPLPHAKVAIARDKHRRLMQLRLCTWGLQINRSYHGARRRSERLCRLCHDADGSRAIEDEQHVMTECQAHAQLRDTFSDLPFANGMHAVMNYHDQKRLADYVCKLHDSLFAALDHSIDELVCAVCRLDVEDPQAGKRLLLCDGECCLAYHNTCLSPAVPVPARHAPFFCTQCIGERHL